MLEDSMVCVEELEHRFLCILTCSVSCARAPWTTTERTCTISLYFHTHHTPQNVFSPVNQTTDTTKISSITTDDQTSGVYTEGRCDFSCSVRQHNIIYIIIINIKQSFISTHTHTHTTRQTRWTQQLVVRVFWKI